MKARVKGSREIVDVYFDKDALNACYPPYHDKEHDMYYQPEQLEWVDNEVNAEPDYWTRLEHTYAGMAMQGILSNPESELDYEGNEALPQALAECAAKVAHALVEKYKKEE